MSAVQTRYHWRNDRRRHFLVDPAFNHEFIENDYDVRCWRCDQKRSSRIHKPPFAPSR